MSHYRNVGQVSIEAITGIVPFFADIMPLYYASRITRAAQIR